MPVAERSSRPGDDDDRIPHRLARAAERLGELRRSRRPRSRRFSGCDARQLLARSDPDALADVAELARLGGLERESKRLRVGDRVPHAAEGDVDRDRAEPFDLERRIEVRGKRRHVLELDALDPAVAAARPHLDRPRRRLQPDTVSGSSIGTSPSSSTTVATQIVFEPDIAGYSVGSMITKPKAQSGRVDGTIRFACCATEPRGSRSRKRRSESSARSASMRS